MTWNEMKNSNRKYLENNYQDKNKIQNELLQLNDST